MVPALDDGLPPESERTVYKRVPAELLERAREAALSDQPPPSFDDSDRTVVFSPSRELLTQSLRLPGPASDPQELITPVAETPHVLGDPAPPPVTEVASSAPSPPKRRRFYGLVAVLVLLLLTAGAVYMHSGRSLLIPSAPTKNG